MPFLYGIEKGYFKAQGIDIERVQIPSSDQIIAPLATDDVQVAATGFGAGLYNAVERDISVVVVADNGSADGKSSGALVVRKQLIDSGQFAALKDLKGRRVALSSKGTSIHVTLAKALEQGGLTFEDIELVIMPFTQINIALANGGVDAALNIEPAVAQAVADGTIGVFKWSDEIYANQQFNAVMYSPQFAKTDVARRFMVAYLQGVRDYDDVIRGKGSIDEFAAIGARHLPVKDPDIYKNVHHIGINPNGALHVEEMRADAQFFLKEGMIKRPPDLDRLVDNSFVQYALQQLGEYRR
jgi:NitT/TauT family transport system substrate-binding protein